VANAPRIRDLLKAVINKAPQTEARITNLASATELIQEISKGSATSVLKEVKLALTDLNGLNVSQRERIRTTLYLDERSQPFVIEVMGALLVRATDPMFVARALPLLVEMWQQLGNSYRKWLDAADPAQVQSADGQLAVCRLLGLQVRIAECLLVRAKPVPAPVWSLAHKLFRLSERAAPGGNQIKLYPPDPGFVTAGSLLGVLHLLGASPCFTLPPGQVLALCEWLWVRQESISTTGTQTREATLLVDLAVADVCKPLRRGEQPAMSGFINCQKLLADLHTHAPAFMKKGTTLFPQLQEIWSGRFRVFSRQSVRQPQDKEALIRLEWTPLVSLVRSPDNSVQDEIKPKAAQQGGDWKPLAPGEEQSKPVKPERARLVNQSQGGLALSLPKQIASEPGLGDLIGVALLEGGPAMLGQVVWLNRSQAKYLGVGVKLLGEDAVVVNAQRVGTQRKMEAIALQKHAPGMPDWTGLILPPGNPIVAGEYLVGINDELELCRLVPMATGNDKLIMAEALPA